MKKISKFEQMYLAGRNPAKITAFLVVSLFLLVFPILTFGQAVSGVTGVVADASGARIPGAQVVLLDTKTSRELTTTANDQGVYSFTNVPPGPGYRLTFTKQGFQTLVINEVELNIGKTETHDAELTAGQVAETVTVNSTTGDVTLNTSDASIGNVIGERQLRELPIQIRSSPAALIGLQPGVIGNNIGTGNTNRVGSVTGARADQGNITVDGIDANDVTTGQAFATVANAPIDSIQEFRATSANPNASEGRSSGGQIQLATKSGTNEFHGSARIYYRSDKFAANSFFNNRNNVPRPGLQRRQFGGSLGGPLYLPRFGEGTPAWMGGKDRLFFFFDYEGRRDDSQGANSRTVPLQHYREGRIAYILANSTTGAGACPAAARLDTRPDCIGFLSPAQVAALDPRGIGANAALLAFINSRYPQANDLTGGDGINTGLFRFNAPNTRYDNIFTGRLDGNINNNQKAFFRTTVTRRASTNAFQQFPGDQDAVTFNDKSYSWVVGHSWAITPRLFNQATVGLSKQVNIFTPAEAASFPNSFNAGGVLTSPFASLSYQDRNVYVPTIRDDMTWNKGMHSFQFGTQIKPIRQIPTLTNDFNFVTLGIGGATTTLNANLRPGAPGSNTPAIRSGSVANYDAAFAYLLGRYASISTNFVYDPDGNPLPLGTGRSRDYAYNEYEFYVQDSWRVRNDLTVNLGLRWHYYEPPYERNGFQSGPNIEDFESLLQQRVQNAANGVAGNAAEPLFAYNLIGKANDARPIYKGDKNNFAPRVGFAYSPSFKEGILGAVFGDRKTAIRGGASLVYDRVGGAITFLQDQSTYIFDSSTATTFGSANATTALLNDPRFTGLTTLPITNIPPAVTTPVTPFLVNGAPRGLALNQGNYVVDSDFQIPYSYQWSFGVQRELPGNFLLDVSYVGRQGRKLWTQSDSAQVLNFRDPVSGQYMFDAFNALQTEIQTYLAANPTATTVPVTPQPWIENQVHLASGSANFCPAANACTQFLVNNFRENFRIGSTGPLIRSLFLNNLLRPNVGMSAQFAANAFVTNAGYSDYHGMLVSLQKRYSLGFTFDVNYTWSHAIDNQSTITNTTFGGLIADALNPEAGKGPADFDVRHLFNANGIWEIPIGRKRSIGTSMPLWLDAIVGGWNVSGIINARSGVPIQGGSGAFTLNLGVGNPPVLIGDRSAFAANIREEGGGIQFFADPAAAQAALRFPRHGEAGTRNIFRSPSFWVLDMAISKRFQMPWSENHRITIRAEAFNVTNSTSFDAPASLTLGSTTFGRITGTLSNPREIQFAIRYDF